jgi:FkbM family methyltransferase
MRGPIAVPYTAKTWLLMQRGMMGATGNYYCGLHEFQDMTFVLHLLRPEDLFVDIGANVGSYTILASGHVGARSITVEPLPATFDKLRRNIRYNDIDELVTLHNSGLGATEESLRFTTALDVVNHVATDSDSDAETVEVPVVRLDNLLSGLEPLCLKIDVEGFEHKVLDGGMSVLKNPNVRAVLMELNGSGDRYGFDEGELHQRMLDIGFLPFAYDPWNRSLRQLSGRNESSGNNTLYLRDLDYVQERLSTAGEIELPWRTIPIPS